MFDRLQETFKGPQLRDWCQNTGLLDSKKDFADSYERGGPISVRMARTFITNYFRGIDVDPTKFDSTANLHAALMLAFCALEAHINSIAEEFSIQPGLSAHEKGMLLERDVRLENGEFRITQGLRMAKLEDRIELLHTKFSGKIVDHSSTWWGQLTTATNLRNQLTHAKIVPAITEGAVRSAIRAIIDALDALYHAIYKRKFPTVGQGLQSRLAF